MRASQAFYNEVALSEGPGPRVYNDGAGVMTVGHGHTGDDVPGNGWWIEGQKERHVLTPSEQMRLLKRDLWEKYEPALQALIRAGVKLTQGQYDALLSLIYNCGVGAISAGTTIGNALRRGNYYAAAAGFMLWNKAPRNGVGPPVVWPGLTTRRRRERDLFLANTIPSYMTAGERTAIRKLMDWRRRGTNVRGRSAMKAYLKARLKIIAKGTRANRAKRRSFIRKVT